MKNTVLLLAAAAIAGCTSSTTIKSSDPEARIYVNGEYLGTGEAVYADRKVAFANNDVILRKDGCEPVEHRFSRNEDADVGAIVGGFLVAVPFLWTLEYKEQHAYEFDCRQAANQRSN